MYYCGTRSGLLSWGLFHTVREVVPTCWLRTLQADVEEVKSALSIALSISLALGRKAGSDDGRFPPPCASGPTTEVSGVRHPSPSRYANHPNIFRAEINMLFALCIRLPSSLV